MKTVRLIALLLSLMIVISAFAGCGKTPPPPVVDNSANNGGATDSTDDEIPKPEFKVTSTFYPEYYDAEYEYQHMKKNIREWFYENLENDTLFSAHVGEDDFAALKSRFTKDVKSATDENGHETVTATYVDATTNMKFTLEAILYKDFPTVDYVIWAEYTGTDAYSAPLSQFNALDASYEITPDKGYKLHTSEGSYANVNDFKLVEVDIPKSDKWQTFGPGYSVDTGKITPNGRSTDKGWPYFDILGKNCGLMLAIGWTGQWEASFANLTIGDISMKVYQRGLDTVLFPGEKVRSPRIVLSYFDGDAEYGHNVLRKLIVEHYTPENDDEKRFVSPICVNFWGGITENNVRRVIGLYHDRGIDWDATWFDAGWYADYPNLGDNRETANSDEGGNWSTKLGWYTVNKKLFPSGSFKNISDLMHEYGSKFLLWWMIEDGCETISDKLIFGRESYYSTIVSEPNANRRIFLNLASDEILEKVLNYFRSMMDEQGVDWIRIDNWVPGWTAWVQNDIEESNKLDARVDTLRQGITENKHILNYYKLWDTLYAEYPDFLLDNCASGGRRLDIEMASRGVALWRTDYATQDLEAMQAQTQWLSYWYPFSSTGNISPTTTSYPTRSLYSSSSLLRGGTVMNTDNIIRMEKIVAELESVRPYWYGSYYQILEPDYSQSNWNAYELFREDWQKGMLVVIRRPQSVVDVMELKLKGLESDKKYLVHNIDDYKNESDFIMTGAELMEEGVSFSFSANYIGVYEISIVLE